MYSRGSSLPNFYRLMNISGIGRPQDLPRELNREFIRGGGEDRHSEAVRGTSATLVASSLKPQLRFSGIKYISITDLFLLPRPTYVTLAI